MKSRHYSIKKKKKNIASSNVGRVKKIASKDKTEKRKKTDKTTGFSETK